MLNFLSKYKILTLALTAILIGVIWRLEIEYYGWEGLIWVTYFHYAVPLGLLIFIIWANLNLTLTINKRIWLNVIGLIFGVVSFYFIESSLSLTFVGGPSALFLMSLPTWKLYTLVFAHLVLIPFLAIGSFILLKLFKQPVSWLKLAIAIVVMVIAVPCSIWILELMEHKGSHDIIHTLKSGMVIPFIVFAVGLVFMMKKKV